MSNPMYPEPMPPIGGPAKPAKPRVPKEVTISFAVWVASTVLASVLQLMDASAFMEVARQQVANQPPEARLSDGTLRGIYIFTVVLFGLLMVLFAWKMRSGRNWARMLLTVLAVLSLMLQASSVGMSSVVGLIGVVITATALVFMYVPAAHEYFAFFRRQQLDRRR